MSIRISGTPLDRAKRIASDGLTFRIPAERGVFPPLKVVNGFFGCGYDDAPEEEVLEWEPFGLAEAEYELLFEWWREDHPGARVEGLGIVGANFSRWFSRAVDVRGG